tara:strand:+ start:10431 stop:10553 length:123 start_codon:yes stop_codon:yes gene_type:complete
VKKKKNNKIIFQSENAPHEFKGFSSNNKKNFKKKVFKRLI